MPDKKQKRPWMAIAITGLGAAGTAAYIYALVWLTKDRWGWLRNPNTDLNELGDFLAGAFGPLAIWWLVLGYFQQGIELRQNSEALRLQAKELKASVEQQTLMVEVAEQQLQTGRDTLAAQLQAFQAQQKKEHQLAQPILRLRGNGYHKDGNGQFLHTIEVTNMGHTCAGLKLMTDSLFLANPRPEEVLSLDRMSSVNFYLELGPHDAEKTSLHVSYLDGQGAEQFMNFDMDVAPTAVTISPHPNAQLGHPA